MKTFAPMIVFPFAKVNLGLHVLRVRPDGYRDIETVFLPIPLRDALELVPDSSVPQGEVIFTRSGIPVPGSVTEDLCYKAFRMLASDHSLPGARMHLHKAIPLGAGLGGGSSDAAHVLKLCDTAFGLGLAQEELTRKAAALGSDCAFFLHEGPQWATARGEVLEPIHLDLSGQWLALVNPGIHISTAEVYAHTPVRDQPGGALRKAMALPREKWQTAITNDLEGHVYRTRPTVREIKEALLHVGAWYAAMSGSGSSVFGLFDHEPPTLSWPAGHIYRCFRL